MDARFETALDSIDAGDCGALGKQLAANPGLIGRRADQESCPYDGYFRRATLLHHCAGNPTREHLVPANIVAVARTLLDAGAEVDAATEFQEGWNWTTLGLIASSTPAAVRGFAEPMIDLLIEYGADVNWGNGINVYGAFFHTVECECLRDVATMLHHRGAELDLGYAAAVGDLNVLGRLLEAGDRLSDDAYTRYRPLNNRFEKPTRQELLDEALVFAAINTRIEAVDRLLAQGAALDGTAPIHGERPTAMHAAAWAGSLDMVRHLLDAGGDPKLRDAVHQSSVIGWADFLKRHQVRDFLLEDDGRLDLCDAVEFGRFDRAMDLIQEVEVDAPVSGSEPGTLLRVAAYHGHIEIVRSLLEHGADPLIENSDGHTALDLAERQGHDEVAALLRRSSRP